MHSEDSEEVLVCRSHLSLTLDVDTQPTEVDRFNRQQLLPPMFLVSSLVSQLHLSKWPQPGAKKSLGMVDLSSNRLTQINPINTSESPNAQSLVWCRITFKMKKSIPQSSDLLRSFRISQSAASISSFLG